MAADRLRGVWASGDVGVHQNLVVDRMVNCMRTRAMRTAALGTAVGLAVFTVSCADTGRQRATTVEAKAQAATPPKIAPELPEKTRDEINVSGALLVEHQLDVAALRAGVISSITVNVDSLLPKGHILPTLDAPQIAADPNPPAP